MNYHFPQADFLSRRALAFSGIAAFHILIAYLLLPALVQPPPTTDPGTKWIPLPQPTPPAPTQATPDFHPSDHTGPIPVPHTDDVVLPEGPTSSVNAVVSDGPPAGAGSAMPAPPVRTLGANQLPNSEDYYPPDMRRLNIEGATNVRVCVDAQGARLGEPTIERSSGESRLDMAAMNVARHGRYARSLQGDTPVGNCFRFRIAFRIPR